MLIRYVAAAVLVVGTAGTALAAGSAPAHKEGEQLNFCGTVIALVEHGCIGVMRNGETLEIGAANPKPAVGTMISGTGTVKNEVTFCMQGVHVNPVTWQAVRVCPLARPADAPAQY